MILKFLTSTFRSLKSMTVGLLGFLFVSPIAKLCPRRKNRIVVIGGYGGEFSDNCKYFFLQSIQLYKELEIFFLTDIEAVHDSLLNARAPVIFYPSLKSFFYLLTSSLVIVDNNQWLTGFKRFMLQGARSIQLWHGVGFKRIELDKLENESRNRPWLQNSKVKKIRRLTRILSGRSITYDLVISTSEFYEEKVFKKAMRGKNFLIAGYPRNTFGADLMNSDTLWCGVDCNLYRQCLAWKDEGKKIVLVMPTFRDSQKIPVFLSEDILKRINCFCEDFGLEMIFKFHPNETNVNTVCGSHLHVMKRGSDIYPFIPISQALVTDYSSVYMDYTLVNSPILFFVPDFDDFSKNDRQIQFDYHAMTPGPKLENWDDVMLALKNLESNDLWQSQRESISRLAFDKKDQSKATTEILNFAIENNWISFEVVNERK